ncbi:Phage-related baseplate assembly protein [Planctomycetes bacterium Pan216]|uniref:Phage-related baseplate assembly protein n=1 Tax=Kolteria novifilia TaxID=2527975 RepID=A0A518B0Y8_9BACT|nr:Phage-related baseplate assembly protein [Planctomycetes bacterium Pan216]
MPEHPSQQQRSAQLTTSLGDALLLVGFEGEEAVSELFRFRLEAVSPASETLPFERLLGISATLSLRDDDAANAPVVRQFQGLIQTVAEIGTEGDFTRYEMDFVPTVWPLTQNRRFRIFQDKTVAAILSEVLGDHADCSRLQGETPRNYCVQYGESDVDFAQRLLEEEGYYFYFEQVDSSGRLIIANDSTIAPTSDLPNLPISPSPRPPKNERSLWNCRRRQELTAQQFATRAVAFQDPDFPLNRVQHIPAAVHSGQTTYQLHHRPTNQAIVHQFPGPFVKRFDSIGLNGEAEELHGFLETVSQTMEQSARVSAEQLASSSVRLEASGNCPSLACGYRFDATLSGEESAKYFVTRQRHRIRMSEYIADDAEATAYESDVVAIPASLRFRPVTRCTRPVVMGHQTALVIGFDGTTNSGSDQIFTDKYGRVRVRFPWSENDHNSCWVRVAQGWAGKSWGSLQIPRVGQEVVIGFENGDPDCPLVYGSVYNGQNPPPQTLPEQKHRSGVQSRTNGSTTSTAPSSDSTSASTDTTNIAESDSTDEVTFPRITDSTDSDSFSGIAIGDKSGSEFLHLRSAKDMLLDCYGNHYVVAKNERASFMDNSMLTIIGGMRGIDQLGVTIKFDDEFVLPFSDDVWKSVGLKLYWMSTRDLYANFGTETHLADNALVSTAASTHQHSSSAMSQLAFAACYFPPLAGLAGLLSSTGLNVAYVGRADGDRCTYTSYRNLEHHSKHSYVVGGVPSITMSPLSLLSNTVFALMWGGYTAILLSQKIVAGLCDMRDGTTGRNAVNEFSTVARYYGEMLGAIELMTGEVRKMETLAEVGTEIADIALRLIDDTPVISTQSAEAVEKLGVSLASTLDDLTGLSLMTAFETTSIPALITAKINGTGGMTPKDLYHYSSGNFIVDTDGMIALNSNSCVHVQADDLFSVNASTCALRTDFGTIALGDLGMKIEHSALTMQAMVQAVPEELSFTMSASADDGVTADSVTLAYGAGILIKSFSTIAMNVDDVASLIMTPEGIVLSYGASIIALTAEGIEMTGTIINHEASAAINQSAPSILQDV